MSSKRSEQSRLYDNIRRRIRHINEKMQDPNNDAIREEGLRRNKEELEKYLKGLREQASKNPDKKLTNEDIYRAVERLKTDDNLTANVKKMDEVTIKSVISDERFRKEMTAEIRSNPELNDLIAKYSRIVYHYIGQSTNDAMAKGVAFDAIEIAEAIDDNELTVNQRRFVSQYLSNLHKTIDGKGQEGVLVPIGEE